VNWLLLGQVPSSVVDAKTVNSVTGVASASANMLALGGSPLTPIWLAPVKWCFMNYNTGVHDLGNSYVFASPAGIGGDDTVTAGANGVLTIDSGSPAVGDRVVVSDSYAQGSGAAPHPEGVYVVTSAGSSSSKWVLTRSSDCNTVGTIGQYWAVQVTNGTIWGGGWTSVGYITGLPGASQSFTPGTQFVRLSVSSAAGLAWGAGCTAGAGGTAGSQVAVGSQATATGANSVAIGNTAVASGLTAHALGPYATASGQQAVALGNASVAAGLNAMSIGAAAGAFVNGETAIASGSIALTGDAQMG
jgi:hypothetical protein